VVGARRGEESRLDRRPPTRERWPPQPTELVMAGNKESFSFEARDYQLSFLRDMMQKYGIKNESKALRVLLDYAVSDGDLDLIFDKKNMRCIACGGVV
jgi:hypothetical protein